MANLFEKPIAANPMSEFVGLPLEFIKDTIDKRQLKYDTVKDEIEAQANSLLDLKYLPGDRERNLEIQKGYDERIESMIDDADGDYSLIQAPLDRLKREIHRDMSYGELGAQQSAYTSAMAKNKTLSDMHLKGDINDGAMAMFNQSMQKHKTIPNGAGGYSSFSGYAPSNISDIASHLTTEAKKINDKYTQSGAKVISPTDVENNISTQFLSNPNVVKAMQESYTASGLAGKVSFEDYQNEIVKGVSETVAYEGVNKRVGIGGSSSGTPQGTIYSGVSQPFSSGSGTFEGGTLSGLRERIDKYSSLESAEEFNKWESSPEGRRLINVFKQQTGEEYPTTHSKKVAWLERNINRPVQGDVITRSPTASEMAAVDNQGIFAQSESALFGLDASRPQLDDIEGSSSDGRVAKVVGAVDTAPMYAPGTLVIRGKNGETVFQENKSFENISSPKYNMWQLTKVKHTNTWEDQITITGVPQNAEITGGVAIPPGSYTTQYNPPAKDATTGKTAPEGIVVSQGGNKKYIIFQDQQGRQIVRKL